MAEAHAHVCPFESVLVVTVPFLEKTEDGKKESLFRFHREPSLTRLAACLDY